MSSTKKDPAWSAEDSVATRFSRAMVATTSPYGLLSEPTLVAAETAIVLTAYIALRTSNGPPEVVSALALLSGVPLVIAVLTTLALMGARRRIVAWLDSLPFPLENLNGVLNGVGDSLEVTFEGAPPEQAGLNASLDTVHPDSFVTTINAETQSVEIRIGVVDSKRNPARSNHLRYARVRAIVDAVLVPLSKAHPIRSVYVK